MTYYDDLLNPDKFNKKMNVISIGKILTSEFGPDSVLFDEEKTEFYITYKNAVARVLIREFDTNLQIIIVGLMCYDLPSSSELFERLNDLNRTLQWGSITYNPDTQSSLVLHRIFLEEKLSVDNFMYPLFHILTFISESQMKFILELGGTPYKASDYFSILD
jgi:hypothetical protein